MPGATSEEGTVGEVDPNYVPILPFTEKQQIKRVQLEQLYPDEKTLGLEIDSIEPNGGPITGETRVLVRGGPFEDLDLIYPRPKCKFGSNDRVVSATYVKCHEKPVDIEDLEGRNKEKVSVFVNLTLFFRNFGASNATTTRASRSLRSCRS